MKRPTILTTLSALMLLSPLTPWLRAQHDIGFIEKFAYAKDRSTVLAELIPGTEEYYFFHALHQQNAKQFDKLTATVEAWRQRYPNSGLLEQISNRQALLNYETDPAAVVAYLRDKLGVGFPHAQEALNPKPNLPTAVDQNLLAPGEYSKHALAVQNDLGSISDAGLIWLMENKIGLTAAQKRILLSRLQRPDVAGIVPLINEDLGAKESSGFGEFAIHRHLVLAQLAELKAARPALMSNSNFVNTWLMKLRPGADVDMTRNSKAREAWLEAAWGFVSGLTPAFNSLKAHVLYSRLVHDEKLGIMDRERFLTYLKLPRPVAYISPKYQERAELFKFPVDLNADFSPVTGCIAIGNDERLVRAYLMHFLTEAPNTDEFAPYVLDTYLNSLYAEANLTAGIGDPEKWFSLLSPGAVQALRERVDIEFSASSPEVHPLDQPVALDVHIKNAAQVTVNVYEINTENHSRVSSTAIGTDINLDGLSPNYTTTITSDKPPVVRDLKKILLTDGPVDVKGATVINVPGMSRRGVWVVDLIGNGKSSRALIRKGQLRFVTSPSSAGTSVVVLDENLKPVPNAYIQLGGQRFTAGDDGEVPIPFSNQPGLQPVVLGDGKGFAQREQIFIQGENYALQAGFHTPRESLLTGRKAKVVIRPHLLVNGETTLLELLEDVKLTVTSTSCDGVAASVVASDFKLVEGQEASYEFTVPDRLATMHFRLDANVKSLITGAKVPLATEYSLQVNAKETTEHTSDLYLSKLGENYYLQELGRTGEPRAERALAVDFFRPEFTNAVILNLKTDAAGYVNLGPCLGISGIGARNQNGIATNWTLPRDSFDYPANLHLPAGLPVRLPCPANARISLLEVAQGAFVREIPQDPKANGETAACTVLKHADGLTGEFWARALEPGDYSLVIDNGAPITIRVTSGGTASGWLLGEARLLELRGPNPLFFPAPAIDAENMVIDTTEFPKGTRLHVFASRYLPDFNAFEEIGRQPGLEPLLGSPAYFTSQYVSGRTLGEEYRYVLERRGAVKFPGSMLPRPGLLLNPWAIRDTATELAQAAAGEEFRRAAEGKNAAMDAAAKKRGAAPGDPHGGPQGLSTMDFLAETGFLSLNLPPAEGGKITLKLADFGDRQFVRILAISEGTSLQRDVCLADRQTKTRNLTLVDGLDPKGHFTRQNQTSLLEKDAPFVVKDARTAQVEMISDLGQAFTLLRTLSNNATLAQDFAFILDWPKLEPAKKRELYSRFACHELSFFLSRKDPEFFTTVITPYLANKRDKTFLDHYLLGADLKDYLRPWNYIRLNSVERILLGQRIKEEAQAIGRESKERYDLLPPQIQIAAQLFEASLGWGGLASGGTASYFGRGVVTADGGVPADESGAAFGDGLGGGMPAPAAAAPGKPMEKNGKRDSKKELQAESAPEARMLEEAEVMDEKAKSVEQLGRLADVEADRTKGNRERQLALRKSADKQQLYRKLEQTQEWAENNYYKLLIAAQNQELVTINGFWKDYALWNGEGGFLSTHIAEATRSFTEIMFALSVLDLPFPAAENAPKLDAKDGSTTITPTQRMILFHREIKPAELDPEGARLLVSQNFYRNGDRYIQKDGEQLDKFVSEEFLSGIVYGCQIVVTNPTSATLNLDLLLQIPRGAMPVMGSKQTLNMPLRLEPYRTHTLDYFFYFPKAGEYPQHPVHVSKAEKVVAFAPDFTFKVVDELTKLDTQSWDYISQFGKPEEVFAFLDQNNIQGLNLDRMAWRLHDKEFFLKAVTTLEKRRIYHHTTWSYSLLHGEFEPMKEFLQQDNNFLNSLGYLESKLAVVDPIARRLYQHLEYSPLVNARAHQLGAKRTILNDRFHEQYDAFLQVLARKGALTGEDQLAAAYYLLLQDRVPEAMEMRARPIVGETAEKLQTDYLDAVLAFYQEDIPAARDIAQRHVAHPVDKWRDKFAEVLAQADEIEGKKPANPKEDDREQQANALATKEASIDLTVENKEVRLTYQNVKDAVVNYYPMDLEFLFSTAPFVGSDTTRFGFIKPNKTETVVLPEGKDAHAFALPREYHSSNVLVEITAGGKTAARAYYANELNIQLSENFGRLQVLHSKDQRPLAKVYVKVFAEVNGTATFYKDGYTDLRGKFDYASLSTGEIDQTTRFSILVMSEEHGAAVKEAKPPRQ